MRLVVLLFLLLLLLACGNSDVTSGNGSETTNGFISVVDSAGKPAANVPVKIFINDYNPITDDSTDGFYTAITNDTGVAQFTINQSGTYNIYSGSAGGPQVFAQGVSFEDGDTLRKEVKLTRSGGLDVFIPATYDTSRAFLYMSGSDFSEHIDSTLEVAGGYRIVRMLDLPKGTMPPIRYYDGDESPEEKTLIESISIEEDTVVDIAYTPYETVKPVWGFSLMLAVHQDAVDQNGGYDATVEKINSYYNYAMRRVNGNQALNGILHFSIDTIKVITGTMNEEGKSEIPESFDYRIIYGTSSNYDSLSRNMLTRASSYYIYHDSGSYLFDTTTSSGVPQIFGQFRGALNLQHQNVLIRHNPVCSTGYYGDSLIMNVKKSDVWSGYSTAVINHNQDTVGNEIAFSIRALPNSYTFEVTDTTNGVPLAEATVNLYARSWIYNEGDTGITPEPFATIVTDENGEVEFNQPIFRNSDRTEIINGNILIEVDNGSGTKKYDWFPILEAGTAWLQGDQQRYIKRVSF